MTQQIEEARTQLSNRFESRRGAIRFAQRHSFSCVVEFPRAKLWYVYKDKPSELSEDAKCIVVPEKKIQVKVLTPPPSPAHNQRLYDLRVQLAQAQLYAANNRYHQFQRAGEGAERCRKSADFYDRQVKQLTQQVALMLPPQKKKS